VQTHGLVAVLLTFVPWLVAVVEEWGMVEVLSLTSCYSQPDNRGK